MNKVKVVSIASGVLLTFGIVSLGIIYKQSIEDRKSLYSKVKQLTQEIQEAKDNESTESIQVLGTTEVIEEAIVEKPPAYVPPVITDPVVDCTKGKCGSKSVKQSACAEAVCCEIKKDTYEWAEDSQKCNSLRAENARTPITLPHNGSVLYCDKAGQNAILAASQYKVDARKESKECFDRVTACEEKKYNEYKACADRCNRSSIPYADCGAKCKEAWSYMRDICGSSASCINAAAIGPTSLELDNLIEKYCD